MAGQILGKVTAGGGTHLISNTFYGTCATAAGEKAKIVKLVDTNPNAATLITGMMLTVKFTNSNSVASPTLTIQTSGGTQIIAAKSIMRYGTTAASTWAGASWRAGAVVSFVYDGTNWVEVSSIDDNSNTVSTAYCDTAASTQAKVASCTNYKLRSGARFPLLLVNTNTYNGKITLNVNSTGAKDLYINGKVSSSSNKTWTQGMYSVYYDGSYYYVRTDTTHNPNGGVCVGASTVTPDPDTKIWIKE